MIKANDIRVGNFIDDSGFAIKVSPNTIEELWCASWTWLKPIPLTEEWLIKFGKINWLYKDTYGYYTTFNNKRIYFKFIHSLQNFYFCVEQKELKVK